MKQKLKAALFNPYTLSFLVGLICYFLRTYASSIAESDYYGIIGLSLLAFLFGLLVSTKSSFKLGIWMGVGNYFVAVVYYNLIYYMIPGNESASGFSMVPISLIVESLFASCFVLLNSLFSSLGGFLRKKSINKSLVIGLAVLVATGLSLFIFQKHQSLMKKFAEVDPRFMNPTKPVCVDSDEGKNMWQAGIVHAYTPKYGFVILKDYCTTNKRNRSDSGPYLSESVCHDKYAYQYETMKCSKGCAKGACIK